MVSLIDAAVPIPNPVYMTNNVSSDSIELSDSDIANITGIGVKAEALIAEILAQLDEEARKVAQKSALLRLLLQIIKNKNAAAADITAAH